MAEHIFAEDTRRKLLTVSTATLLGCREVSRPVPKAKAKAKPKKASPKKTTARR